MQRHSKGTSKGLELVKVKQYRIDNNYFKSINSLSIILVSTRLASVHNIVCIVVLKKNIKMIRFKL